MTPRILKKTQLSFIVITLGEQYRLGLLTNGLIILPFLPIPLATGVFCSRVLAFYNRSDG